MRRRKGKFQKREGVAGPIGACARGWGEVRNSMPNKKERTPKRNGWSVFLATRGKGQNEKGKKTG